MCNRTTAGNDVISRRFIRETYGRKAWVDTQNKVASGGYLTKFYLYIGYVAPSTTYHIHLQIWQPVPDFQASQPQFTLLWDSVQNINKQGLFQVDTTFCIVMGSRSGSKGKGNQLDGGRLINARF